MRALLSSVLVGLPILSELWSPFPTRPCIRRSRPSALSSWEGMGKVELNYLLKDVQFWGWAVPIPYLRPRLGPSLLMLGARDTNLGHSIVVGRVLGALVVVALQGLGKDVVSEMNLFFLTTYDFLGMSTTAHPHRSSVAVVVIA